CNSCSAAGELNERASLAMLPGKRHAQSERSDDDRRNACLANALGMSPAALDSARRITGGRSLLPLESLGAGRLSRQVRTLQASSHPVTWLRIQFAWQS